MVSNEQNLKGLKIFTSFYVDGMIEYLEDAKRQDELLNRKGQQK